MPGPLTQRILETLPRTGPPDYHPAWDEISLGSGHYDMEGEPITMREWTMLWREDIDYRRIAFTETNLFHISTVWLGLDHSFGFGGRPLIFESMVFANDISISRSEAFGDFAYHEDKEQWRYATLEDALEGHAELVEQTRAMEAVMAAIDPRDQ